MPWPLYLQRKSLRCLLVRGWIGVRNGLDDVDMKKSCLYWDSNSDSSSVQPMKGLNLEKEVNLGLMRKVRQMS
jgi:hypothetical protein